jgi:hypothetical protein
MGMACTREMDRVCAAMGELAEAPSRFEAVRDVPNGGVLWALPALLLNGLLLHAKDFFSLPKGFYSLTHIFLLLAYMSLARVKSVERLRYVPTGEWGKLLGLDRIPEVRTLREKLKGLSEPEKVREWSSTLSQEWMEADPAAAGVLYVDGHIRSYYGHQTRLPRRYVPRQRLCLRGLTDYWVNDQIGRPFFVVSTPLTGGLLKTLREEIVPRLLKEVPGQPSQAELEANPYLARFTLIFDREGYSPDFFREMWERHRVACQTYHKHPKEDWPEAEFRECCLTGPYGNQVEMKLGERGVKLSNGFWVREIRKWGKGGHQVSVIGTDYTADTGCVAVHMFSRWSQENFFKYMMEHFYIDGLAGYQLDFVDETSKVVNPAYRRLEGEIKRQAGKKGRKFAQFGEMSIQEDLSSKEMARYETKKAALKEEIDALEKDLTGLKEQRKQTPKHVTLAELPEPERFAQLAPTRKQFMDTIKMIAYRAETAMAIALREENNLARADDARPLLREIFTTDADLIPNEEQETLTVQLHHLTNHMSDRAARLLAATLNDSGTLYPGTNLRLVYKLVSDPDPPGQEF